MAAVPIQIDGVLWDHAQKKPTKVSLIGHAHILGLSVGGGPIMPPDTTPPSDLHPEHPMVPPGGYPHPEHPIVIPPPDGGGPTPPDPPTGPLGQVEWHTIWTPQTGWAIVGVPVGEHVTPSKK